MWRQLRPASLLLKKAYLWTKVQTRLRALPRKLTKHGRIRITSRAQNGMFSHFCHVKYGKLLIRLDHRSPDGTTVITDSADHHIRTFVLLVSHCSTGIIFQ